MSTEAWLGSTDCLISREDAENIATRYGRELGLAPFEIKFAKLLDRDGEPIWFVPLMFTEDVPDWIGLPDCAYVHVHAQTGVPESIPSL